MIYFWDDPTGDGGFIGYGANVHDARNRLIAHFDQTAEELDIVREPNKTYKLDDFQFLLVGQLIEGW